MNVLIGLQLDLNQHSNILSIKYLYILLYKYLTDNI